MELPRVMTTVGRVSSAIVVFSVVTLVLLASVWPNLMHIGPIHVVDWVALMLYVAAPVAWISAILHWARRSPRVERRRVWGLVAVLGFVPGAIIYWFWGVSGLAAVQSASETGGPD
ncbi:MAG: hypothetical protein HKN72_17480 [Gemmatimonadetes bacterium]|nr:hypothetical protein [Gemmatimonadota bacterium]